MSMKRHCDFCDREVGYLQADMNIDTRMYADVDYPGNWTEQGGRVKWDLCDKCADDVMGLLREMSVQHVVYDKEN